ncbi:MAG: excinuclease ABC subunit A [Bacteroidales bacterium]|nr:excinuclease ABC subunit A [Bacteroidales bacterium]
MRDEFIHIKGARVNNLKNIDVDIPRNKFTVITGISGSGKSSLAFDTLYAEGQRRFAESISSFARQFLGMTSKPAVDLITGIPPAIAIEQKVNTRNTRSTVGTTTEIYDYLRLLFAKVGKTISPVSGREVTRDTAKNVADYVISLPRGSAALILAEIKWDDENKVEKVLSLKEEGFNRLAAKTGEIHTMDEVLRNTGQYPDLKLLVDRIRVADDDDTYSRILDSVQTAFTKGEGYIFVVGESGVKSFSNLFEADGILFEEPSEQLFSYNNPLGACPNCKGFGNLVGIDEALVVPDQTLSVYQEAVACWHGEVMKKFYNELVMSAYKFDFPIHKPYMELSREQKEILWRGNQYFTGIDPFFEWVESNRYKIQFRTMMARYVGRTTCHVCGGSRLRKEALWVKVGGKNISELMDMTVKELITFFDRLVANSGGIVSEGVEVRTNGDNCPDLQGADMLSEYDLQIAERPLKEIRQRLEYIQLVGLSYLTLNRAASTLSGGESQRINLVSSLGNNLVGSMYILDEPSIGLHSRDTQKLISVLKKLRDLGNTVVVVEHDEEIMRAADELIDIGPLAGINGGEIMFQGRIEDGIAEVTAAENAEGDDNANAKDVVTGLAPDTVDGTVDGAVVNGKCESPEESPISSEREAVGVDTGSVFGATEKNSDDIKHSLTIDYLSGKRRIEVPAHKRHWSYSIELVGAMHNNLKNVSVKFPLRCITAVTGVSGSGKSSLVGDVLYPALYRHINQFGQKPGLFRELRGDLNKVTAVEYVDQNPIGKSSRSNPVTYLKVYDDIRKLYSEQPYAKLNGYGHSQFSFNIEGGRCPECLGDGYISIPMQFMSDVKMVCESCGGKRFKPDILEVKYQGKDINDVLNMSVEDAVAFFGAQKDLTAQRIAERLQPLLDVGLSYVQLGQNSSTLSGGESQRIKLASFLGKDADVASGHKSILFIFDEPTTGLHFYDTEKLLASFNALVAKGHSILVVEHNLDVIRCADWVIELGPDAGDKGGEVIFEGTPENLALHSELPTGAALLHQHHFEE